MKQLIYFFFVASIILFACKQSTEVVDVDLQYELQDEIQKKFMAVKIVKIHSDNAIDAFGNPILENRWYGVANLTKSFFPISWTDGKHSFNFDAKRELFYPDVKMEKEMARVVATNATALGAPVDVEILLLGPSKQVIFMKSMESSGEIKVTIGGL